MITDPIGLELYDINGQQYRPHFRNLQMGKAMEGGEDLWLSFMLDREPNINYPDIGQGHDVILRRGLNAIWKGEMREITQDVEDITIGCLGQYVHLEDANYGGEGRMWCESRFGRWKQMTNSKDATFWPEKYEMDNNRRLYMAPRKNEHFQTNDYRGGWFYYTALDEIYRVSFDYDFVDPGIWQVFLYSVTGTPDAPGVWTAEWTDTATRLGIANIQLQAASGFLVFYLQYMGGALTTYTGETGEDCRFAVTNLRLWRYYETESPSMIHVSEKAIEQIQAATPISADEMQVLEKMFVRDYFTDANGTLLANHQPDEDKVRGGWTVVNGGFDIQGNQANVTALGGPRSEALAVIDSGESDGVVSLDIDPEAVGDEVLYLVFRYQDVNNFWMWGMDFTIGVLVLANYQAGVPAIVFTSPLYYFPRVCVYNMMVYLRGDRIDCYCNGIWRYGRNDTLFQTQTEHGMRAADTDAVGARSDNFEMFQALPIWPLFYEKGENAYDAVKDSTSFGDWNLKKLAWGVETGGDRVFVRSPERDHIRYIIESQYAERLTAKAKIDKEFLTEAWAKYIDEEGVEYLTAKYYAHLTDDGIVANTTATGNDLASTVYGVVKDKVLDFGRVDQALAVTFLQQYLREHAHPNIKSSFSVFGPVRDMYRDGAWMDPSELEMGYICQIPYFRASEAEGAAGGDWREWDTTFLLVGMEWDAERGIAKLIPEGASEDLRRMIQVARAIEVQEGKQLLEKRPWFPYM